MKKILAISPSFSKERKQEKWSCTNWQVQPFDPIKDVYHGKYTDDDFTSMLKQSVKISEGFDSLKFNVLNFIGFCAYFFGKHSLIAHSLPEEVYHHICGHHTLFGSQLFTIA